MPETLRAPFPWFGGKALAADLIWERFGTNIGTYIEPFFGSGAVLLNAHKGLDFAMTLNDIDCHIANFWRSVAFDPEAVAYHASQQINECELQARHQYLVDLKPSLADRLKADIDYHDPRIAGWWAWGCCCWIGSGWCKTKPEGRGVKRQLPEIAFKGRGVNRQLPPWQTRDDFLNDWMQRLNAKVGNARIACGDWSRVCSVGSMIRNGVAAVLLDPPYGTTGAVYAHDSSIVADNVQAWCIENGDNPKLKIALCGHVGQHEALESLGWDVESPKKAQGYQGADDRERIWFSPHCEKKTGQLSLL